MKESLISHLSKITNLPTDKIESLIEIPKDASMGDYAFPCFSLAKDLKKSPVQIAQELQAKILKLPGFSKIQSSGPYLNFFLDTKKLAEDTIKQVLKQKNKYGNSKVAEGKTILIEFPSPNTNKPLHLGHLRNMSLGESISRIIYSQGNKVIKANLNNDRGVHICKSMLAYKLWGKNKTPKSEKIKSDHFVGDYYVMFAKAAKENPILEGDAQEMLTKWEMGDKEILSLWKKMNSWALSGFKETFKLFGIKPDKEYFESKIYKEGKEMIKEGLSKGIFYKNKEGAIVADLKEEGLGEKVVLRADGTSIYITQDLYLAILKNKEFKLDGSIYVVANEQDYHFKVLFSILKKFGYSFTKNLHHLSYGIVELPEGRMKSREGTVVDADDIILETQKLAKEEIKKREPKLKPSELDKRSLKISLGAIKYMLLKVDSTRNMVFNPNEAISFEGDTGPYLLYSYARAKSILRKVKKKTSKFKFTQLSESERNLVNKISRFPDIVTQAYEQKTPHLIAGYAFQLAQAFNEFYHLEKVIGSECEQQRLLLVEAYSQVLKNAINLLGIETIEKM